MVSVRDTPYTVTNSFKRGLMMRTYSKPIRHFWDDGSRPALKKRRVESFNQDHQHQPPQQQQQQNSISGSENNLECAIRESSAAVLSSPSRRTSIAFSEDVLEDDLSTPPSSPPPPTLQLTPPPASTRKPTFSFLKRKRATPRDSGVGTPLTEVNSNSFLPSASSTDSLKKKNKQPKIQQEQEQQKPRPQPQSRPRQQTPPKRQQQQQQQPPPTLRQMQLDLGGEIRKTCSGCGMEYIPSNPEDTALHKKFHDMNSNGIDLGKAFVRANASRWVYEAARFDEGYVVIIDRKSTPPARNQAKRVLEVVNQELSAPQMEETVLWSQVETPKAWRKNGSKEEVDRYKVFLHMKDSKCVGVCLTERIWESYQVKREQKDTTTTDATAVDVSSSITLSAETSPAIVGVSRVWTSASARRKGIAMDLLDCVVGNYFYGIEIPKAQIAFSQPTESGCRLMEAFFGPDEPWYVYKETYETA